MSHAPSTTTTTGVAGDCGRPWRSEVSVKPDRSGSGPSCAAKFLHLALGCPFFRKMGVLTPRQGFTVTCQGLNRSRTKYSLEQQHSFQKLRACPEVCAPNP